MYWKLAWRNLWRNKRRTYITMASIVFAVFLATGMKSLQDGSWDHMINSVVGFYTGYGQVHTQGYWAEQSIDKVFPYSNADSLVTTTPHLRALVPRLESFALASAGNHTKGAIITGIDPESEDRLTQVRNRLTSGSYLESADRSVLVAEGLAKYLHITVGDTLVLLGQGYHGASAVGKYAVKGLVRYGAPDINNNLIVMPLTEAQWLFAAEGMVTTLVTDVDQPDKLKSVMRNLQKSLGDSYEVMDWQELMPELVQAMKADKSGGYIMFFIIYMVIGFGIFSTVLMMTVEREHEFGVLLAIGMKRLPMTLMLFAESVLIAAMGILAGSVLAIPLVAYFSKHPIYLGENLAEVMEVYGFEPYYVFSTDPMIFADQALIILGIVALVFLLPLWRIGILNAVAAMRS